MEQAKGARNDEGIYKRLPQAFPRANELFRVHKRHNRTRACANILRREIRPCFASVALRVSQGRYAPGSLAILLNDDRGGCFSDMRSFVGDGLARPVFRACRLRGGVRLFAGGAILAAARSHSRSDITP